VEDPELKVMLGKGIAIHNGKLKYEDR